MSQWDGTKKPNRNKHWGVSRIVNIKDMKKQQCKFVSAWDDFVSWFIFIYKLILRLSLIKLFFYFTRFYLWQPLAAKQISFSLYITYLIVSSVRAWCINIIFDYLPLQRAFPGWDVFDLGSALLKQKKRYWVAYWIKVIIFADVK